MLEIIFKDYLEYDILPSVWKKANIVPVHKKVIKIIQITNAVSLLLIWGKILERLSFSEIFIFFTEKVQSPIGFKDGDPNINQLLTITQNMQIYLMKVLMFVVSSLTSLKHLIKYGTITLYSS